MTAKTSPESVWCACSKSLKGRQLCDWGTLRRDSLNQWSIFGLEAGTPAASTLKCVMFLFLFVWRSHSKPQSPTEKGKV